MAWALQQPECRNIATPRSTRENRHNAITRLHRRSHMNLETVTLGRDDGHGLAQSRPAVDVAAPVHPEEKRT